MGHHQEETETTSKDEVEKIDQRISCQFVVKKQGVETQKQTAEELLKLHIGKNSVDCY